MFLCIVPRVTPAHAAACRIVMFGMCRPVPVAYRRHGAAIQEGSASWPGKSLALRGLQTYSNAAVLWDELDAGCLQGGPDGTEGAGIEGFAAL